MILKRIEDTKVFTRFANATEGTQVLLFFVTLTIILWGTLTAIAELEIDTPHNKRIIAEARADCAERGGKWIVNPKGFTGLKIEGMGCNLDYQRRALAWQKGMKAN